MNTGGDKMTDNHSMSSLHISDLAWRTSQGEMTVSPDASVDDLLAMLDDVLGMRQVYVVDKDGRLCGTISTLDLLAQSFPIANSASDVRIRLGLDGGASACARDLMKLRPLHVTTATRLTDAVRIMLRERVTELPVVDGRMQLLGEIGTRDMLGVQTSPGSADYSGRYYPETRTDKAYVA
jgi:CBS domain-containing protein